jgi:acyl-CoA oxidase
MHAQPHPDEPTALQTLLHNGWLTHRAELDSLLNRPEFSAELPGSSAERHLRTYRRLAAVGQHQGGSVALTQDTDRLMSVFAWMAVVDPAMFHAALVHFGVCTWSILTLGRPGAYLTEVTHELDRQVAAGTIMITEVGRGNSHIAVGTRARFHPESRTFTLHTPDPGSTKIMANVAAPGPAKTSIVYAELMVDEQPCGVFPFTVRVRTEEGMAPGVRINALSEVPAVSLDYALSSFEGAEVPYDGWLRDSASISVDGAFEDPLGDTGLRLVRSLSFSAHAALGASVGMAACAQGSVTAALRYSSQRPTAGKLAPGMSVLGYHTQQVALYSALADVYALTFLAQQAKTWFLERKSEEAPGSAGPTWAPWAAVHSALALTKAAAARTLAKVTASCRMHSGGQGLLISNRVTEYEFLAQVYQEAVGDNILIRLDAGKSLAQDVDYQPVSQPPASPLDLDDPATVRALAAFMEAGLLAELRSQLQLANPDATPLEVWNPLMHKAIALADAYLRCLTLHIFEEAIASAQHDDVREPLRAVQMLYGLNVLEEDMAWHLEHGSLSPENATRTHAAHEKAVKRVHDYAPMLVDGFAIPQTRLRSQMAEPGYITMLTRQLQMSGSETRVNSS